MYKSRNNANKSTFEVILFDEINEKEVKLSVYEPKQKVLKRIGKLQELDGFEAIDEMTNILAIALSNNKEKIEITSDFLEDIFDMSDISDLYTEYFSWILEIKKK